MRAYLTPIPIRLSVEHARAVLYICMESAFSQALHECKDSGMLQILHEREQARLLHLSFRIDVMKRYEDAIVFSAAVSSFEYYPTFEIGSIRSVVRLTIHAPWGSPSLADSASSFLP